MKWACTLLLVVVAAAGADDKYLAAVREFSDNVLKHGRDHYGPKPTPLFVDGLDIDTREPARWKNPDGSEWVISNLGNQQILLRILDGVSALTGDARYRDAAAGAVRYALGNLRRGGLLAWGGHMTYDATHATIVWAADKGSVHELKEHYPYYELFWQVDRAATKDLIETIWNSHVLDWSVLDFNRHGSPRARGALWASEYKGGPVFFWGKGLTFVNAGSDLYLAAAMLGKFTGETAPLEWAKRLARRYVETRNPKTGIGGYQFSQTRAWCDDKGTILGDRAQYQYGDYFPGHLVVEGTLFPTYGGTPGVLPQLCQLHLADVLGKDGAEFGKWAVEELAAWAKSAYRVEDNTFIPMLTDGTSMEGFVIKKDGYFGPKGRVLRAGRAGASHFWAYAMAWRQSGDARMKQMAEGIAKASRLDSAGEAAALFGWLEMYRKSGGAADLETARRVGDNILAAHFQKGFFVRGPQYVMARFDSLEAFALLHLSAEMQGKSAAVPACFGSGAFYSAPYADRGHTYDSTLYSRTRGK
jgi:pectate lyase